MRNAALDLVITALEKIRETNDHLPRASKISLGRLEAPVPLTGPARPEPVLSEAEGGTPNKAELLAPIRERVRVCTKCAHLACSRTQTVFGVGNPDAELMFIGEAPGVDEDRQGEPFVGRAGQLLTRIIETMGLSREEVYIANILKCRPDTPRGSFGNRPPTPLEMQTCRPYLVEQIDIIQPKVLVALGAVAVEGLLGTRGNHAGIARQMAFIQRNSLDDYLSSGLLASEPGAFRETESLGRYAPSFGATRAADHRATTKLFSVGCEH